MRLMKISLAVFLGLLPVVVSNVGTGSILAQTSSKNRQYTSDFRQEDCTFSSIGRNPYFI